MKILTVSFTILIFIFSGKVKAQTFTMDSIVSIVATRISQHEVSNFRSPVVKDDYNYQFYIDDISNRVSIKDQGFGIYEFGLYGDDIGCWIMLYDKTGYKILEGFFNTEMYGDILSYINRNQLSDKKALQYLKGLYDSLIACECIGEREITE